MDERGSNQVLTMSVSEETNEIENEKQDKRKDKSSFPRTMKP